MSQLFLHLLLRGLLATLIVTAIVTHHVAPHDWLAFTRSNDQGQLNLYLMDVPRRLIQPLGRHWDTGASEFDWSTDGRLAFRVGSARGDSSQILIFDAHTATFFDPLPGTGVERFPAWSTDGRLAFAANYDTFGLNLFILDPTADTLTQITTDGQGGGFSPAWSAAGQLAFVLAQGSYYDVAVYDPATGARQPVASQQDSAAAPTWSPAGLLAFQAFSGDLTADVALTVYDGVSTLTIGSVTGFETGDWSRDGRLAYISDANLNDDILIYDERTRQTTSVTQSPSAASNPRWSPDGQQLVFTVNAGGSSDLYLLDLTSGTQINLTQSPENEYFAAWME